MSASLMSLAWFVAILVLIPVALLVLKRSGMGAAVGVKTPVGAPKMVASLAVGAQQRVLTVEVGEGAARRWLVLGVTAQSITPLHTLDEPPVAAVAAPAEVPPFAQVLGRMLGRRSDAGNPH